MFVNLINQIVNNNGELLLSYELLPTLSEQEKINWTSVKLRSEPERLQHSVSLTIGIIISASIAIIISMSNTITISMSITVSML